MRTLSEPCFLWFTKGQGRITVAGQTRGYTANNAIFMHQYRAHWHFAFIPGTLRELKRMLHPVFMGKLSF